jgi:UPF0755 protein
MAIQKKRKPKLLLIFLIIIILLGVGSFIGWNTLIGPVDKNNSEVIEVTIPAGTNSSQIGKILKEKNLIHNEMIFKLYLKMHKVNSLKASVYLLHQDMSMEEIVKELEEGSTYNPDMIKLTFKEGLRITDFAEVIEKGTNHKKEEFITLMKNRDYIKTLIPDYWFLTDEILNQNIYYPLEGYLAPDTYYFDNKDVEINDIVVTMLKQNEKNLKTYEEKIKEKPHYYLTMASIAELEGTNTENKEMIVGIFENRLSSGMNMGSDVTTYYGLQLPMTSDLTVEQFNSVNAYNTRSATMIGKMPAGPICNPGKGSISASVNPTKSDYFYFVADKNGKIYYTKTASEHAAKVQEIKDKGDWIW